MAVVLISEITAEVLAHTIRNNCMVYHVFAPLHFIIISAIYYHLAAENSQFKYFTIFSCLFIFVASLLNTIYLQPISIFPSNIILANSVFFLMYTLFTFRQMLQTVSTVSLLKQSIFWFNAANLIYISITFFYWALYNLISVEIYFPPILDNAIIIITILVYAMYGLAMYFSVPKTKQTNG